MQLSKDHPLPSPPDGKIGWPWRPEGPVPESLAYYPRISIITASYQQGHFIERTIRSVLLQGYPNLEYFILDAESTDGTIPILKKYEPWLDGWVSKKDDGQADAINKGWARSTGEIYAWINSDDWYAPGALHAIAQAFLEHPEASWVHGAVQNVHPSGATAKYFAPKPMTVAACIGRHAYGYHQPGVFWRASLVKRTGPGPLDPDLSYCFTHDFWLRMLILGEHPLLLDRVIAYFQWHAQSKSCGSRLPWIQNDRTIFARHVGALPRGERSLARRWLMEAEADVFSDILYGQLAAGERLLALSTLVSNLPLLPLIRPRKGVRGLLWRVLVTGRPPTWFQRFQE